MLGVNRVTDRTGTILFAALRTIQKRTSAFFFATWCGYAVTAAHSQSITLKNSKEQSSFIKNNLLTERRTTLPGTNISLDNSISQTKPNAVDSAGSKYKLEHFDHSVESNEVVEYNIEDYTSELSRLKRGCDLPLIGRSNFTYGIESLIRRFPKLDAKIKSDIEEVTRLLDKVSDIPNSEEAGDFKFALECQLESLTLIDEVLSDYAKFTRITRDIVSPVYQNWTKFIETVESAEEFEKHVPQNQSESYNLRHTANIYLDAVKAAKREYVESARSAIGKMPGLDDLVADFAAQTADLLNNKMQDYMDEHLDTVQIIEDMKVLINELVDVTPGASRRR